MRTARASTHVIRLIDANTNRALEGLRVCEDLLRFHYERASLYRRVRVMRHALAAATTRLPFSKTELLKSRQSRHDLGKQASSGAHRSIEEVMIVNFQRAKESLRVLEECARLIAPQSSSQFQHLRFTLYELERTVLLATLRHH